MIKLKIKNKNGETLAESKGIAIDYTYTGLYKECDYFTIEAESKYLTVQLDSELVECMIYIPSGKMDYVIPYGEKLNAYGEKAFVGDKHIIKLRCATDEEIYSYRNVALNSVDKRGVDVCYPHAVANFVTRDESVFEERNAIDGHTENDCHGNFPYQSWGGGAREDIDYKLYFGRQVEIDKIVFYLRADYTNDHDTYWKSITIELSDGTLIPASFDKTGEPQAIHLGCKKVVEWLHLKDFKQASNPLTWAALTEIEVYGNDVKN